MQVTQDLVDEWFSLARLSNDEVPPAFLSDFDKRVARHVLDTLMSLVHELKQFVDNPECAVNEIRDEAMRILRFEEFPVCLEEPRVLANNVHDVTGHDCLVVLASFHFCEAQKIFDNRDQKAFLSFLICKEIVGEGWHDRDSHLLIAPDMEPIAQQSVLRLFQDHSDPSICLASFSVRIFSVSVTSKWVR